MTNKKLIDINALKSFWTNLKKNISKKTVYIGLSTDIHSNDYDFICTDSHDNYKVIQEAIDYAYKHKIKDVIITNGNYMLSRVIYVKPGIHIHCNENTKFTIANQTVFALENPIVKGSNTLQVSSEVFNEFPIGAEIGLTDGSTGYVVSGSHAQVAFVTNVDEATNTLTLSETANENFTTIVTLISGFRADDIIHDPTLEHTDNYIGIGDIQFIGGEIDGNKSNQFVWISDMHQNGLIFGGVSNLVIKKCYVHDFRFQNIHVTGKYYQNDKFNENSKSIVSECISKNSNFSGICIDSNENVSIENCISSNNGGNGLQLVASNSCIVIGGSYENNIFCGIRSCHDDIKCNDIKITNATTKSNSRGIGFKNMKNCTIESCTCIGDSEAAIYIEEDCKRIYISDCLIYNCNIGIKELSDGTLDNSIGVISFDSVNTQFSLSTAKILINDNTELIDTVDEKINKLKIDMYGTGTSVDITGTTPILVDLTNIDNLKYKIKGKSVLSNNTFVSLGENSYSIIFESKNKFILNNYKNNILAIQGYMGAYITGLKPNTQYICSTNAPSDGNTLYFYNLDLSVEAGGGQYLGISDSQGRIPIWILQRANYDGYMNGTYYIQVEEGDVPTTYSPYMNKTVKFSTVLRGIDSQTYDYLENGKLHKKVDICTYDGSQTINGKYLSNTGKIENGSIIIYELDDEIVSDAEELEKINVSDINSTVYVYGSTYLLNCKLLNGILGVKDKVEDIQESLSNYVKISDLSTKVSQLSNDISLITSHIGMIIQTTTLDTEEKVINIYGGSKWEKIEGMFLLGQSSNYAINSTGGESEHILTVDEMPNVENSFCTRSFNNKLRLIFGEEDQGNVKTYINNVKSEIVTLPNGGTMGAITSTASQLTVTDKVTLTNNGKNQPHNNMPPYKVVYIWERVK